MKNHFINPYSGNKRDEVEEIYKSLDLKNIKYICEPFCGSSAMSYYISTLHPKKYTYILNDIDNNLMKLYELMKDEIKWNYLCVLYELHIKSINNKEFYKFIINQQGLISYLIRNRFYKIRPGMYPMGERKTNLLTSNYPIINFMRNEEVILFSTSAENVLNKFNNKETMFLMDPPYLFTCNSFYNDGTLVEKNFNIYEYVYYKKFNCPIYFILEYQWMINILFNNKIIHKYTKKYNGIRKKTVQHCVVKV